MLQLHNPKMEAFDVTVERFPYDQGFTLALEGGDAPQEKKCGRGRD